MTSDNLFNSATYKSFYNALEGDEDLRQSLLRVIKKHKAMHRNPNTLIKNCLHSVADYEYIRDCAFDGDIMQVFDEALEVRCDTLEERIEVLKQINFALELFTDCDNLALVRSGKTDAHRLFEEYAASEEASAHELRNRIGKRLTALCLSDEYLTDFTAKIEKDDNVLDLSIAFAEKDYKAKCIAAMERYLSGNCSCMQEAAYTACHEQELKGITTCAKIGGVRADEIYTLLICINTALLAVCVIGLALIILGKALGLAAAASVSLWPFVVCGVCGIIGCFAVKSVSHKVGALSERHNYRKVSKDFRNTESERAYDEFARDFADCNADIYDEDFA